MRVVQVERRFDHPVERVWARYTDHVGWSDWAGAGRVRLAHEGSPDRDGVGCVRAFAAMPGLREEVTVFEPPRRMEYKIVRGGGPIVDHRGEVILTPDAAGTLVTWRVSFRPLLPGLGWLMEKGLTGLFRRMLAGLARDLHLRG